MIVSDDRDNERFARLDALARHTRILMLQGPNGPFFARLARRLSRAGTTVTKVNFNGGDAWFFRGANAAAFRGRFSEWPDYLREVLRSQRIEAVLLFGQYRPMHEAAMQVAREAGVRVYVFEEGYARPWWITLEEGGVNDASLLGTVDCAALPVGSRAREPVRARGAFLRMAFYSTVYFCFGVLGRRRFVHYRHHKPFCVGEAGKWVRAGWRRWAYAWRERSVVRTLLAPDGPRFFLVPLQLAADSQIVRASLWRSNDAFICAVIESFARCAAPDERLVFKHHPLERGHADYGRTIREAACRYGVSARVDYVHDAHLPSLLQRSKGVVLVNSTTGISAMFHRVPVCVTGKAFYARPGLTDNRPLDKFWRSPRPPERASFLAFYRYMLDTTQINASFYACGEVGRGPIRPKGGSSIAPQWDFGAIFMRFRRRDQ